MRTRATELDVEQDAVVNSAPGPVLVVAGAGTGKTRTLTHRVSAFVRAGVPSDRILLLTFTHRAAQEMRIRVGQELDGASMIEWAGTFHAVGARIIRSYADRFGYEPNFSIAGPREAARLFAEITRGVPMPEHIKLEDVLWAHSLSLNSNRSLESILEQSSRLSVSDVSWVDHLIDLYVSAKMDRQVMDYDDLLSYWYLLLTMPDESAVISGLFDAIFVDEYQDVCPLQALIVDAMARPHANLTVVGDDCQSIYGFRGADIGAIMSFGDRYPSHRCLFLQSNYRSSPEIVALANRSISHNVEQYKKTLTSVRGSGPKPTLVDGEHAEQIASFVAHRIQSLHREGVPYGEQAVLYRAHAQSRVLELELQRQGIPYAMQSGQRILDRPHVAALLSVCRVDSNPWDRSAWLDIIGRCQGLGPVSSHQIVELMLGEDDPWKALDERVLCTSLPARFRRPWSDAVSRLVLVRDARKAGLSQCMMAYCEHVLADSVYQMYPGDASDRLEDLAQMSRLAAHYHSGTEFLQAITLGDGLEPDVEQVEGVVLSTVHRSKGLEWAAVFMVGLYEGGFPMWPSRMTQKEMDEERRLFYVGLTRASRWLYLCHPWSDMGRNQSLPVSRFVDELDPGMLEHWHLTQDDHQGERP